MKNRDDFFIQIVEKRFLAQNVANWVFLRKYFHILVVCDHHVQGLYGFWLVKELQKMGIEAHICSFPAGEKNKNRVVKSEIEDSLIQAGANRQSLLIALGGGVVTDMVGFISSTLFRGVDFIAIPTTLMAMVDAAIGGKNGVNTEAGKNLIGTFYHPLAIFTAPEFLETLDRKELLAGAMEVYKYGLIWKKEIFIRLSEGEDVQNFIELAALIKEEIISKDQKDLSLRRILNFGHTFAHALERYFDYELTHGQALWAGLMIETIGSFQRGFLKEAVCDKILNHLQKIPLHFDLLQVEWERLFRYLKMDKKASRESVRISMIDGIGSIVPFHDEYVVDVSEKQLKEMFEAFLERIKSEILHTT